MSSISRDTVNIPCLSSGGYVAGGPRDPRLMMGGSGGGGGGPSGPPHLQSGGGGYHHGPGGGGGGSGRYPPYGGGGPPGGGGGGGGGGGIVISGGGGGHWDGKNSRSYVPQSVLDPSSSGGGSSSIGAMIQNLQNKRSRRSYSSVPAQIRRRLKLDGTVLNDVGSVYGGGSSSNRLYSRSVSWNSSGQLLAFASSDRCGYVVTLDGSSSSGGTSVSSSASASTGGSGSTPSSASTNAGFRVITSVKGHTEAVERIRFHPGEHTVLCTAAQDRTVRIWDVRGGPRCHGVVGLQCDLKRGGRSAASVEWHPASGSGGGRTRYLAVTERDNAVHVYDVRKLQSAYGRSGGGSSSSVSQQAVRPVRTFRLDPHVLQECHFSPSGTHLVAATRSASDGTGEVRVWRWDQGSSEGGEDASLPTEAMVGEGLSERAPSRDASECFGDAPCQVFPGHTGAIYAFRFSPDGTRLATGGNDALVGLWNVQDMVCTGTVVRRGQFVRSVSFSHDSRIVAVSSGEDCIDLANAQTGEAVGMLSIGPPAGSSSVEDSRMRRFQHSSSAGTEGAGEGGGYGADEVAFHPKAYLLACARGQNEHQSLAGGGPVFPLSQITIARLSIVSTH